MFVLAFAESDSPYWPIFCDVYRQQQGAGLAQWYSGLNDRRFVSRQGARNFSLHHRVQNGSGVHPASYPMGIRSSFPGGKAAGS
jgi:hypothetical protein